MTTPQCPICYPLTFTYDPPTSCLRPEACPARDNHPIITRAFAFLRKLESSAHGFSRDELIAKVRADIERLRTAHQIDTEQGKADEISVSARVRGRAHENDQAHPGHEPFGRLEDGYLPPLLADGTEQTAQALWDEAARQTRKDEVPNAG